MSVLDNLRTRFHLLRIALGRRFIYPHVVEMAKNYGLEYRDLCADTHPFEFVRRIVGKDGSLVSRLDFAQRIEPAEKFTPPDAPGAFNSEVSVARFLGELVFYKDARTVVELGCFVGWTTAHMALAIEARGGVGRLFALDYQQEYLEIMRSNLRRQGGIDRLVTPLRGFSLDSSVLAALPQQIDVLFIDTAHGYPETRTEILTYSPRLAPGGCIVLHDSTSAAGVRRSVNELAERFDTLTFATERSNGVTVLMSRSSPA